jgi:hypothetical protein
MNFWLTLCLLGWSACAAYAAGTTSQPAPPDYSTPVAAAKSLYNAVQADDPGAIQDVLYAANDQEKQLCRTFADLLVAGRKLQEAVRSKFAQGDANFAAPMITQSDLAKYDQGHEQISADGDEAQLTLSGQAHPLKFKKVEGKWKVIASDYAGATPANLPQQMHTLARLTRVLTEAAADVDSGKYPTAAEAEAGIQQKLYDVIIDAVQKSPPTTQK